MVFLDDVPTWIILVVNTALGIWLCGVLARRNGRDANIWQILGLLFGLFAVLALLIALLLPDKKKRCPFCMKKIHEAAKVCAYCRNDVSRV